MKKTYITFTEAFLKKYFKEKYVVTHLTAYNEGRTVDWQDLTKVFLVEFVDYLMDEVSQNSARTYCAHIKAILNKYSEAVKIVCKDYAKILSLKKIGVLNTYLTPDEIQILINYKPQNETEHTIRNQFVLSCLTGMRHSDVIHLDETNINNSDIIYVAQKTKTVVNTVSCSAVEQLIAEHKNHIYSGVTFNQVIKVICENAGINTQVKVVRSGITETGVKYNFVSSHTARRSFATNAYLATLDLMLVSKMMGHSDVKTTQNYICCDFNNNKKVKELMNSFVTAI